MNLKDFTFQLIDYKPIIQQLRNHFVKNDPSVYATTHFLTDTASEKFQFLSSNFINIFEHIKQHHPKELPELVLQLDQIGRVGLHSLSMVGFYPPVKLLSSDEQLARWEKLILDGRLVGAYAQTELAHGSDVQSLLTKAVYNKEKKCFILSSPGVGATKYWVGCLGMHATHIVTQAQTYIEGKHYGIQTFVVPIRDPKTYKLYDGIEAGDIGAKLGLPYMDNGYMRFNNLEVPLENLCMKFLKVQEDGKVIAQGDKNSVKIGYGGMLSLRVVLVKEFIRDGYKGIMSLYRNWKSADQLGPVQRRKLLKDFACTYTGLATINLFKQMHERVLAKLRTNLKEALEELDELHITISGLKAYYAWVSVDQLRRSTTEKTVGNLLIAGSAHIYSDRVPAVTYEGDNIVLLQQTARGLCKYMQYVESEKFSRIPPTFKFLADSRGLLEKPDELKAKVETAEDLTNLDKIEEIINAILLFNVKENYEMMKEGMMKGESPNKLWNEKIQKSMVEMALRVTKGLSFKMAKKTITGENTGLEKKDAEIVRDLMRVHGLGFIQSEVGALCRFNIGASCDKVEQLVREAKEMVLKKLEGSVEYIGESHPFLEEELVYARDYKQWTPRPVKKENLEKSLKEQAEKMKECINSFSKL